MRRHHVVSETLRCVLERCTNVFFSACLPVIRQLLAKLFPIIHGSSVRSRRKYYNYDDSRELQKIGRSHTSHDVRIATSGPSDRTGAESAELKEEDGILVETSYTIKSSRNELDEVSLVSHEGVQRQ